MPEVSGDVVSKAVMVFAQGMGFLRDTDIEDIENDIALEFLAFLGRDVSWIPHDDPTHDAYIVSDAIVQKLNLLLGPNGLTIAKIYREKRKTPWGMSKAITLKCLISVQIFYKDIRDWWSWRWSS